MKCYRRTIDTNKLRYHRDRMVVGFTTYYANIASHH